MHDWTLQFHEQSSLPKLAWLAEVATHTRIVTVHHGRAVETGPQWCVEGTWDAAFEAGDFHRAENLFGSGVRIDGPTLTFASSVARVDRLFHVAWNGRLLVSNSLIQLLARIGARLDVRHNYRRESFASGCGFKRNPSAFRIVHPTFQAISQEYHCNLAVDGDRINRHPRSQPRRFACFDEYHDALSAAFARIADNYRSGGRRRRAGAYSRTSTGYDSTAVTALARATDVTETFAIAVAPGADAAEHDSGAPIAHALGVTVHGLSRERKCASDIECWFLAASVEGSEVFLENVAQHIGASCRAAVLYTGYHGDVAETNGVPRELFGQRKRAQVRFYGDPRDAALRAEFREYLAGSTAGLKRRLMMMELLHSADHAACSLMRRALRMRQTPSLIRSMLPNHFDSRSLVFVWAADSLAGRYASAYDRH